MITRMLMVCFSMGEYSHAGTFAGQHDGKTIPQILFRCSKLAPKTSDEIHIIKYSSDTAGGATIPGTVLGYNRNRAITQGSPESNKL